MSTPPRSTRERYAAYADRIADVSPSYAAWARSLDDDLVALDGIGRSGAAWA